MADEREDRGREAEAEKRPYEAPTLTKIGSVAELTQGNTTAGTDVIVVGSR